MKKLITLLLFIVTLSASAKNFFPGQLVFSDGNIRKGWIKVPESRSDKYIFIKATEKDTKEKISSDVLKSIIFDGENGEEAVEYTRVYTFSATNKKSSQPYWLEVLVKGHATLYATGGATLTSRGGGRHAVSDVTYYAQRSNEEAASYLGMDIVKGAIGVGVHAQFKKYAGAYFSDNQSIVKKIENKEYKIRDLIALVNEYNASQKTASKPVKKAKK